MDINIVLPNNDDLVEIIKNISNLSIINDGDNGISLKVRLIDKDENIPPHAGYLNFKNVKSKSLEKAVSLLYNVVGMLYVDGLIRSNNYQILKLVEKTEKDLCVVIDQLQQQKKTLQEELIKYKCVDNIPDVGLPLLIQLDELRTQYEIYCSELNQLKLSWQASKDENLYSQYVLKVKNFRSQIKKINELVDIINDRYIKKLNIGVSLDRQQMLVSELEIQYESLIDRLKLLRAQVEKINPNMVYTTKRLDLEEDYEL